MYISTENIITQEARRDQFFFGGFLHHFSFIYLRSAAPQDWIWVPMFGWLTGWLACWPAGRAIVCMYLGAAVSDRTIFRLVRSPTAVPMYSSYLHVLYPAVLTLLSTRRPGRGAARSIFC